MVSIDYRARPMKPVPAIVVILLSTWCSRAFAEATDVDVTAFEYVDVVETSDGSLWKGVLVEQTPNVQYKIATADGSLHVIKAQDVVKLTKERNRAYRTVATRPVGVERGVSATYESSTLP